MQCSNVTPRSTGAMTQRLQSLDAALFNDADTSGAFLGDAMFNYYSDIAMFNDACHDA